MSYELSLLYVTLHLGETALCDWVSQVLAFTTNGNMSYSIHLFLISAMTPTVLPNKYDLHARNERLRWYNIIFPVSIE